MIKSHKSIWSVKTSWALARGVVALVFLSAGFLQLFLPLHELKQVMPWVAQHPEWFTCVIGVVDVAGGIGLLVPGFFRLGPVFVWYAAIGCASKQVLAILFHLVDGDVRVIPLNILLLALSLFLIRVYLKDRPRSRDASA